MQLRYRLILPLAAFCLALAVAPALAAKPAPTSMPSVKGTVDHQIGSVSSTSVVCSMGILPPPALAFGYILPPGDQYYTLLDPRQCPPCHNGLFKITTAHMLLYFTEPCEIPVTVSIVPAFENTPGCFSPNPYAPPLCPPTQYIVNDGGILNDCVDYALPVAASCCIDAPVFLMIQFDQGSCQTGRPAFCGPGSCTPCTQYNFYPGAGFPGDDLCLVLSPQAIYGVNMWADADCCLPTATLPGSWGTLKTLYR